MEKFKEKKIVIILDYIPSLCLKLGLIGLVILPITLPLILLSNLLSNKNKFIIDIKLKLKDAKNLDDLKIIRDEFYTVDNDTYCLSYKNLKEIEQEIISKIEILEKMDKALKNRNINFESINLYNI